MSAECSGAVKKAYKFLGMVKKWAEHKTPDFIHGELHLKSDVQGWTGSCSQAAPWLFEARDP